MVPATGFRVCSLPHSDRAAQCEEAHRPLSTSVRIFFIQVSGKGNSSVSTTISTAEATRTRPLAPVISISPVVISAPRRPVALQVRVSAPATGHALPILLLSHGDSRSTNLSSLNGYAPLANFWAAHGFVVMQPTHLDSPSLGLPRHGPEAPLYWRSRVEDMKYILDRLGFIEAYIPALSDRLDRSRIAVAGHSMGAHTAAMLLGARQVDPDNGTEVDLTEPRIKAGVLLSAPGGGGTHLTAFATRYYSFFMGSRFAEMKTPTLVVAGDQDISAHLTARGADWHADPYVMSTGPKCLVTLYGAGHCLGGISGYDAGETTDEDPDRLGAVQQLTWAYLRTALYPRDDAWSGACATLLHPSSRLGCVESK